MNGDDTDPHSEQNARTWAAAGPYQQAAKENSSLDRDNAQASSMGTTISEGLGTETTLRTSQPPPLFEPAIPQLGRLHSYVSEPPSTLRALSMVAEEEAAAQNAELGPSPFSAAAQNQPSELKSDAKLRDSAWIHAFQRNGVTAASDTSNKNSVFGLSRLRTDAGDLAGAELRHRRRPPQSRPSNFNAQRSLSRSRTIKGGIVQSAGGVAGHPKTRVSTIQGLVRRRDADVLFADSKSESGEGREEDIDKIAKGAVDSPRSGTLQREKFGSEFDIEMPAVKPNGPFHQRRKFKVFIILLSLTLSFFTAGVCLLIFDPSDQDSDLQAWRICFFVAGLPIIWYTGHFVTHIIVWAVERSMFTVKNALYFAYAVRRPLRNVLRAVLCLIWWPVVMTIHYTGNQSSGAEKAYDIILRIWGCITIFMGANLLKVLLGKILALQFIKESQLNKMYATLKKEQWLHSLLMPRQNYAEAGLVEGKHSGGDLQNYATEPDKPGNIFSKFKIGRSASAGNALADVDAAVGVDGAATNKDIEMMQNKREEEIQWVKSRSSRRFSGKFRFWKSPRARLDIIPEESANNKGPMRTNGGATDIQDFSITIDDAVPTTPMKAPAAVANTTQSPSLPPVRVIGSTASFKLQRTSGGPVSPLPPRSAIDAAYAAQKSKRFQTFNSSGSTPAAAVTSSAPHQSRPSPSTAAESLTSAHRTNTSLHQQHDVAVGSMPDLGTGPLCRDEVMTRLARLEGYIRKTTLEVTYRDALNNMETSEVTNKDEAKRIGLFLFWNVKSNFEKSGFPKEDLEYFIQGDDVDDAFEMLDVDGDGKVTVDDCISAVQTIYQERSNLVASLKDTKSIAASLEMIIGAIIHLICVMFYFIILLNTTFGQIWAFVSSIILGLSFIFGGYISNLFVNSMFLFNSHPYDVGDMLLMDDKYLTVDEIQIDFTIFITSAGRRMWIPNQKLVTNPFVNLTTSEPKGESISILLDMDTPAGVLDDCLAAMNALIEEMPQEYSGVSGSFREAKVPMKMTLYFWVIFTHSGTDLGRLANARTKMYLCVAKELQKAGVAYTWPAMKTSTSPTAVAAAVGAAAADPHTSSVVGVL